MAETEGMREMEVMREMGAMTGIKDAMNDGNSPYSNVGIQLRRVITEQNRRISLLKENLQEEDENIEALRNSEEYYRRLFESTHSEERYRSLFESAQEGILILDADTCAVVDVNPFLIQLLGYSRDEFCGKLFWEIGVFKGIAASRDAFKVLQDNTYVRYEDFPMETRNGQSIAVDFISNVHMADNGRVIQCNIRVMSVRKRDEPELP
ncbi:MAG: PAS domain S-box protein [Desulfuromonadales bacterium]